jgi:uncharacterized membrane protein (UPF0127 family)
MKSGFIKINNEIFHTLLAVSAFEQQTGLMNRNYPIPNMTFLYSSPRINKFWMKNTKVALDIVFCRDNKIVEICKGEPYSLQAVGSKVSDLVVEFPFGTMSARGVKIGDPIELF